MTKGCAHDHKHDHADKHGHTHKHDHDHEHDEAEAAPPTGPSAKARATFRISGMDCAEEVATLKAAVGPAVGGADNLVFDILNGRMGVVGNTASNDDIIAAVARTGMKATLADDKAGEEGADDGHRQAVTRMTWISGVFLIIGFAANAFMTGKIFPVEGEPVPLAAILLFVAAIIAGGRYVFPKALFAVKRLRPDMNLLMTVAVAGAAGIGEWSEAATVAFLFSLSLALEAWSVGRARRAIAALMKLAPETAKVRREDGKEEEVSANAVPVGATVIVMAGERIPVDGTVSRGESHVNQAPITGESVPVAKTVGGAVYTGTINGDGTLEITVTKAASDSTFAQIIRMVGEAQSNRAPSEQWVEKFARIYTPVVMALAAAAFLLPPLLLGLSWEVWFYRALVLLVIACPCALVISTPVSIVAALASAARAGVLVKGGAYLEIPARIRAIALDKTGTITEGKPAVVEVIPLSGHSVEELLERAAALEARSTHPLATAILNAAKEKNVTPATADDVRIIQGKGMTGHYLGKMFWLGSVRLMQERKQETIEVKTAIEKISKAGRTVIVIGNDSHVCGLIAVADAVRPQIAGVIQSLKDSGVEHIIMLTGDNKSTASGIAEQVGLTEVKADLLPEDKVTAIEDLLRRYETVAMVGDGVNDAPAMTRASLGIAMGAIGSDAAIESADIALMSDDLSKLPWLINHSRRTLSIIKQNIGLSLATKALFLGLTMFGLSSLWMAIAADTGTTLVVIANGLRLLRSEEKR
jgi:Cd2+/Zn2+-exporting ATPase